MRSKVRNCGFPCGKGLEEAVDLHEGGVRGESWGFDGWFWEFGSGKLPVLVLGRRGFGVWANNWGRGGWLWLVTNPVGFTSGEIEDESHFAVELVSDIHDSIELASVEVGRRFVESVIDD